MRNWLKILREKNSLKQYEMGELLNVSQACYGMIESGNRQQDLKLSVAIKISDLFGISLEEIKKYEQAK